MMITREFDVCPRCGFRTKKSTNFLGGESEYWYECTNPKCNTYINTFVPQEHQEAVLADEHKYIGNFGGYGSGKTTTTRQEIYKHIFLTPNANILIGANVASQFEQTLKRDIESDLPIQFFKSWSTQKQYYDLINGARLIYRPLDDEGKLRSMNLTMFVILEASEVHGEIFIQLKSRSRNTAATIPERDAEGNIVYDQGPNGVLIPRIKYSWIKGIIESNPDAGKQSCLR